MECEICGEEFRPSGHGRRQRYCSESCRNKAKYRRRRASSVASEKPSESAREPACVDPSTSDIDRRTFDRMMDGSHEDTLREIVDVLRKAMHNPATPANALGTIASKLAEFDDKLRQSESGGGLFDDDETEEVDDDVGASIV